MFKSQKNLCNFKERQHLFSAIKHTFLGDIDIPLHLVFICIALFRTVLANHV